VDSSSPRGSYDCGDFRWSLLVFLQRSTKPQVKLDQTVTQRPVAGDDDEILITVDVRATNIGKVKVDLQPGQFDLLRLNPPQGGPLISYALRALSLEPGESDQALFKTVIVRSSVKTVQVHSDYKVPGTAVTSRTAAVLEGFTAPVANMGLQGRNIKRPIAIRRSCGRRYL
jgi:hypothetical protein